MFLLRQRITPNICLLFFITLVSWGLGQLDVHGDVRDATTIIILMAWFKIRLVFLDFMEIRQAPLILRVFCETWIAVTTLVILILHWNWTRHA